MRTAKRTSRRSARPKDSLQILMAASEAVPFIKTGGLADVCGALPVALEKLGHEVIIIMPHYRCVGAQKAFSERACTATVGKNIKVFFLIQKDFFGAFHILIRFHRMNDVVVEELAGFVHNRQLATRSNARVHANHADWTRRRRQK